MASWGLEGRVPGSGFRQAPGAAGAWKPQRRRTCALRGKTCQGCTPSGSAGWRTGLTHTAQARTRTSPPTSSAGGCRVQGGRRMEAAARPQHRRTRAPWGAGARAATPSTSRWPTTSPPARSHGGGQRAPPPKRPRRRWAVDEWKPQRRRTCARWGAGTRAAGPAAPGRRWCQSRWPSCPPPRCRLRPRTQLAALRVHVYTGCTHVWFTHSCTQGQAASHAPSTPGAAQIVTPEAAWMLTGPGAAFQSSSMPWVPCPKP